MIEKFKEKPRSEFSSTFNFSRSQQFKSMNNSALTNSKDRYSLTKEEEESMLVKLSKLNISYVE